MVETDPSCDLYALLENFTISHVPRSVDNANLNFQMGGCLHRHFKQIGRQASLELRWQLSI